tara:strand:- start:87 stop:356 length:270 start_codon:yes stop_codon:yes gene_type:complete
MNDYTVQKNMAESLLESARDAHTDRDLDTLTLILWKVGDIWSSNFMEFDGVAHCEVPENVSRIWEVYQEVELAHSNLEAHLRFISRFIS